MPLDAVCLAAVVRELEQAVTGDKIDKIHQPGRNEVVLSLRGARENRKLFLSANPAHPRVHLTALQRENPERPPMFCMLLRKHLAGARILSVTQPSMERIVSLQMEAIDELGDPALRSLVLEVMGARANLLLLDGEGRIIDCLRRTEADSQRQVLPGLFYRLPPGQGKADPLQLEREQLCALLRGCTAREPDRCLLDTFSGISPLIAREIVFRAGGSCEPDALGEQVYRLTEEIRRHHFAPYMLLRDSRPSDFSFLPILQYGAQTELREFATFSELLDTFYAARETMEHLRQRGQDLIRAVTGARDRTARKLANQTRELAGSMDREHLRRMGDLITSNLYAMEKGMRTLRTADYYEPDGREVEVKLDPLLTPQQNAARYYKEYRKAKTAERVLTEQLEKNEQELRYLNSVLESLQIAEGERDLQEIRQELEDTGYLRRASGGKRREKKTVSRPMEFQSSTGLRISVGKNNTQNDQLTLKLAGKDDIWLHTQKIHGSHVILWTEGKTADARSVTEAAMLAAWFSQARDGQKVPVDYTPARYVKKPAGARPGMVVYTTYETAYVTPEEDLVRALRADRSPQAPRQPRPL